MPGTLKYIRCRDSLVREGGGLENHWWQHLGSSNLPFGVFIVSFLLRVYFDF